MDDALIVAIYVMIDDTMKTLGQRSHCLAGLSDAEILTIAVLAARYYGNHRARAVGQLAGSAYFPRAISPSRFNRRLHALADWLELFLTTLGDEVVRGQAAVCDFVIDSLPLPVCRRERAKAAHRIVALFDAAVILLHPIVHVAAGPVLHLRPQRFADGARVGVVPVRGHLLGGVADLCWLPSPSGPL